MFSVASPHVTRSLTAWRSWFKQTTGWATTVICTWRQPALPNKRSTATQQECLTHVTWTSPTRGNVQIRKVGIIVYHWNFNDWGINFKLQLAQNLVILHYLQYSCKIWFLIQKHNFNLSFSPLSIILYALGQPGFGVLNISRFCFSCTCYQGYWTSSLIPL